jgi:hypothetical protein
LVTLFERNRFKYGSQLPALGAIDHLHKTDPAFEVRAKVRDPLAVLRFGPETSAVGQHRFQYLKIAPTRINLLVHDDTGETLSYTSAHDSHLIMVHAEAFLKSNGRCMRREALDTAAESSPPENARSSAYRVYTAPADLARPERRQSRWNAVTLASAGDFGVPCGKCRRA